MNNTENDSSNSTARVSAPSSSPNAGVSLVESRRSNRTLGCVGLSVCVHVAFLAALAIAPASIRNMGGGDGQDAGAGGSVSMIDSSSNAGGDLAAAVSNDQPVEVSVMTDSSSDIVMSPVKTEVPKEVQPEKLPEKLVEKLPEKVAVVVPPPVEKPVKAAQPPVVKPAVVKAKAASTKPVSEPAVPVITEDQGVPVTQQAEAHSEPQSEPEVEVPVVAAAAPVEEPAEEVEEPSAQASSDERVTDTGHDDPAPVLLANPPGDEAGSDTQAANSQSSAQGSGDDEGAGQKTAMAAGQGGDQAGEGGQNAGGSGAVIGPIRDASDLRALPGNPNPVYPARDRLARKEGTAVILGRVSADGRVTDLKLEKSSGSQAMDSASIQAFRSWRFQGGQQGWIRKPFQFRLVGEAKEVPAPLGKTMKR